MRRPDEAGWVPCLGALFAVVGAACTSATGPVLVGPFTEIRIVAPLQLDVVDGVHDAVTLHVEAQAADGSIVRLPARRWQSSDDRLARVETGERLVADGALGGDVTLTAEVELRPGRPIEVTTTIDVAVLWLDVAPGIDPSIFERSGEVPSYDPAATAAITHPLAGTRLPADIPAIAVHWRGGDPGDVEILTVARRGASERVRAAFIAYRAASDPSDGFVMLELRQLRALLETDRDTTLTFTLSSFDAATGAFTAGDPVTVELVPGVFAGAISYGDERGRLLTIDWAAVRRSLLVPSPTPRGADQCLGCHTYSPDREVLFASAYETQSAVMAYTWQDLTRDPAPLTVLFEPSRFTFPALATGPAGRFLLAVVDGALVLHMAPLAHAFDIAPIEPPVDPSGTHPAWTSDASRAAWVRHDGSGDEVRFAASDLVVARADGAGVLDPTVRVSGASLPDGSAIAHPSFTPDGAWIAFAHGPQSSLGYGDGASPQSVYLVGADDGAPIRLARASLSTPLGPSAGWPSFLPWTSEDGTIAWLAFASRAPFADDVQGTGSSGRRQLWVSAIDLAAAARGEDPSAPPFWLPGQDPTASNLYARALPVDCLSAGGYVCTTDAQCCEGLRCVVHPEWGGFSICE